MTTKTKESGTINIYPLELKTGYIPIVGISSLICERFAPSKLDEIEAKQTAATKTGARPPKDPQREYQESLYPLPDGSGYGFPAVAFKKAAVDAARQVDGLSMVSAKQMFYVRGVYAPDEGKELVPLKGEPRMRRDYVRNTSGVVDLRYHGEFTEWSAILRVEFDARAISEEQLVNLFNLAGFYCGVGGWRPSAPVAKTGSHGRFTINMEAAQAAV